MGSLRKYLIPKCPHCGKDATPASHLHCNRTRQKETLWIDIRTGTIVCDSCNYHKELTTTENLCSCGAIFKGGYLWKEMIFEYEKVMNLEWFKALQISKGDLKTRVVRYAYLFPEYVASKGYKVRGRFGDMFFSTIDTAMDYIKREIATHDFTCK